MSRDCTRCHGFGEYMYAADSSGHVAYTSCPDCDGYGILPDDKGQSRRWLFKFFVAASAGATLALAMVTVVLTQMPGVCR